MFSIVDDDEDYDNDDDEYDGADYDKEHNNQMNACSCETDVRESMLNVIARRCAQHLTNLIVKKQLTCTASEKFAPDLIRTQ